MARSFRRSLLLVVLALAALPATASAAEPPWCGTPEPDFSSDVLPDGTDPADPPGSFPHIPYYAIGCTLADIEDRSRGRMKVEVIGKSALGPRPCTASSSTACAASTSSARTSTGCAIRALALESPVTAQRLLRRFGDDVKVPILVQGGIHGNEYEGVDSVIDVIEKFATTPYGTDPAGRRDPQQRDPGLQRDPEPGRARLRHARERQRVRPQPRLPHAVAAGDAATRSA